MLFFLCSVLVVVILYRIPEKENGQFNFQIDLKTPSALVNLLILFLTCLFINFEGNRALISF